MIGEFDCFSSLRLLLCPSVWSSYPSWHRPRFWLAAYWIFAAGVWVAFLAVCFYRSR